MKDYNRLFQGIFPQAPESFSTAWKLKLCNLMDEIDMDNSLKIIMYFLTIERIDDDKIFCHSNL